MPGSAGVAEWIGTGLQSRLHGFESRHSLHIGLVCGGCLGHEAFGVRGLLVGRTSAQLNLRGQSGDPRALPYTNGSAVRFIAIGVTRSPIQRHSATTHVKTNMRYAWRGRRLRRGNTLKMNRFGISSVLAGLAAAVAIAATPSAGAAGVDATPMSAAGETQPTQAPPAPTGTPTGGTVALRPGGQIDTFPQDQTIGGADPLVPFGTDPFVPSGVWTP